MSREMKDSSIAWIGEIPKIWTILKVKDAFVRKNQKAHQENPIVLSLARSGVKVRDISNNEGQIAESYYDYNPVEIDDLLINPMDLYSGANCSISKVNGVISPAYVNLRHKENISPRFYDYYFKTQYWAMSFFAHGKGISFDNRWTLGIDTLLNYYIPFPSFSEQQKIAEFLDRKCGEIDELVALQEKMIEELKAYKQSVITEAVTKGLNPNAPMKDSGIAWIGEIPEHWEVCRVKNLCNLISKGATPSTIDGEAYKGSVRFIKCENIVDNKLIDNSQYYISSEINNVMKRSQLVENDVLFVIAGATIGKTAIVKKEFIPSNTNQAVSFIRLIDYNKAKLLWYILQSKVIQTPLWINAVQSAQPNLSMEDLGNFTIIVPNTTEQQQIADYLDRKCAEIDELVAVKQKKIETLKEYKKSLIYEYVTGKKEVI